MGTVPEVIVAEVQQAQTAQRVVDEGGALQPVGGQIQEAQVPLVHRVALAQRLQAVGRGTEPPEGARQAGGQVAQPVVRQIEEAQMGVDRELSVQVEKSVVGQI